MSTESIQDLVIIGGGINGAGIAADAAARGLKVTLLEQDDLGSATSSASSGFIHGGLRYLEQYEFKLVRHALAEREVLLKKAPHLIHPLSFVLPYDQSMRPKWMMRAGLWLYDHLAKRQTLAGSKQVDLHETDYGVLLKKDYATGFTYTDCQVDDARLVIANAQTAREKGAVISPRAEFLQAKVLNKLWQVQYQRQGSTTIEGLQTRVLINAAGPWVSQVRNKIVGGQCGSGISLVKGSHIVLPQLYPGNFAYILQNEDQRVIFIAPYHGFTMIGTTDVAYSGDPAKVVIEQNEIDYLCQAVNHYLKQAIKPDDVVHSWSGVRALYDDGSGNPSQITRDYHLEQERIDDCPLISVFGGKITTYRVLAEEVLAKLATAFFNGSSSALNTVSSANTPLVGGDLPVNAWQEFCQSLRQHYSQLPENLLMRYAKQYGSQIEELLLDVKQLADLGEEVVPGLYAREIDYLQQQEWAKTAEDILWRRTKLGLHLDLQQQQQLEDYLSQ